MIRLCATLITAILCYLFITPSAFAAASSVNILSLNTGSTNVTTGAYVQMSASSPIGTKELIVTNATSQIILIAFGASGSEVGIFAVNATSNAVIPLSVILPAGSRISVEAISATASSGFITVSLLQ